MPLSSSCFDAGALAGVLEMTGQDEAPLLDPDVEADGVAGVGVDRHSRMRVAGTLAVELALHDVTGSVGVGAGVLHAVDALREDAALGQGVHGVDDRLDEVRPPRDLSAEQRCVSRRTPCPKASPRDCPHSGCLMPYRGYRTRLRNRLSITSLLLRRGRYQPPSGCASPALLLAAPSAGAPSWLRLSRRSCWPRLSRARDGLAGWRRPRVRRSAAAMRSSWALEAGGRHGHRDGGPGAARVPTAAPTARHAERVLLVVVGHTGGASRSRSHAAARGGRRWCGCERLDGAWAEPLRLVPAQAQRGWPCRTPCSRAGTGRRPQRPPAATAAGHTGR